MGMVFEKHVAYAVYVELQYRRVLLGVVQALMVLQVIQAPQVLQVLLVLLVLLVLPVMRVLARVLQKVLQSCLAVIAVFFYCPKMNVCACWVIRKVNGVVEKRVDDPP
jgi:hypothetical protein